MWLKGVHAVLLWYACMLLSWEQGSLSFTRHLWYQQFKGMDVACAVFRMCPITCGLTVSANVHESNSCQVQPLPADTSSSRTGTQAFLFLQGQHLLCWFKVKEFLVEFFVLLLDSDLVICCCCNRDSKVCVWCWLLLQQGQSSLCLMLVAVAAGTVKSVSDAGCCCSRDIKVCVWCWLLLQQGQSSLCLMLVAVAAGTVKSVSDSGCCCSKDSQVCVWCWLLLQQGH